MRVESLGIQANSSTTVAHKLLTGSLTCVTHTGGGVDKVFMIVWGCFYEDATVLTMSLFKVWLSVVS